MTRRINFQYGGDPQILMESAGEGVISARGTTVPSDGATGWAVGCKFIQTDGSAGTIEYTNEGSRTSADFNVTGSTVAAGAITTLTVGGVVQSPVFVPDATPYTVLAANSGKLHVILEQASSITLNLPAIAAGLSYKFIMGGVATEAQNWVIVATTPSFLNGGIAWTDLNDAESNLAVVYGNGTSHLTLTVTTPAAGTVIEIYSNGTEWFVHGDVISDSTPAFS